MGHVPNHLAGQRVGNNRIELVSLLGEGSYGAVYRGFIHRGGGRNPKQCAVKVLRIALDERSFVRQRLELELHKRVSDCDGVVTLYETFRERNYLFIVMKLCPDRDLWYAIHKKLYLGNDTKIKNVFTQVLDAVEYCHSHSVFHRDIKPENILLCEGGHKALLSDFGLATPNCISTEMRTGSPWYMSPECWGALSNNKPYATAPNDIWSLGILLLNLTCRLKAPWSVADLNDRFFREFVKQPYLFRLFAPLYPDVHDILSRVFLINPAERINIKDLKAAIQKIKHFGIPTRRLPEYYNYQRQALRVAIAPTTLHPSAFTPASPTCDQSNRQNQAKASRPGRIGRVQPKPLKTIRTIIPLVKKSIKPQAHHSINITIPSPVVRRNSRTLPLSLVSPSSGSLVDSDGPVTPQMHVVAGGEIPEININDSLQVDTLGFLQPSTAITVPIIPVNKCGELAAPENIWQSILDTMNKW